MTNLSPSVCPMGVVLEILQGAFMFAGLCANFQEQSMARPGSAMVTELTSGNGCLDRNTSV